MLHYSAEKNVLQLISLLKANNIRKFVISPGTTNVSLVASIQQDEYFQLYSCVDERSAAYMACGICEESGEPVALSCTGATASRNYYSALTEAYYRKLPIIAITSSRSIGQIGQNIDQVTDRTQLANDVALKSVYLPVPENDEMCWENNVKINIALIELRKRGGGPVHINLMTKYLNDFTVKELPPERVIKYYSYTSSFPKLNARKIGIFVGAHKKWEDRLLESVDKFCALTGAVVLYEPESNYIGEHGVPYNLVNWQISGLGIESFDLLIHIGDVALFSFLNTKSVWRVNPDGQIRDTFRKLTALFDTEEQYFFDTYNNIISNTKEYIGTDMYSIWSNRYKQLISIGIDSAIPFSNIWIAMKTRDCMPKGSELHLGILNTARSWSLLTIDKSIDVYCNTGGYGIDGGISSLIGASFVHNDRLYFGIFGDLAFFYDMNCLGNRHIGKNIRIIIINNGLGCEFKNHMNFAQKAGLGDEANNFIAGAGHFGNKSKTLIKDYVQNLGFKYYSAENKKEFESICADFFDDSINMSMVMEVFTTDIDDDEAIHIMRSLDLSLSDRAKVTIKNMLGDKTVSTIRKVIKI